MAEAYYEPIPATDSTLAPVPGAAFQVFEIADTTFSTPLSLRVGAGNPTTTVTASDTLATLPGVYVTSDNYEHHWVSGSFVWRRDSIDGAKLFIEEAKVAATEAASAATEVQTLAESGAFDGAPGSTGPQGERGLPGLNAVENDTAFAAALATEGTETNAAASATIAEEVEKSSTGYQDSPPVVQAPTLQPAAQDSRLLATPTAPGVDSATVRGARRNLWQYTEDVASSRYSVTNATKQTDTITTPEGVTLTRVTTTGFSSDISSPTSTLGLALLTPGNYYLISYWVQCRSDRTRFFWMRRLNGNHGHSPRMVQPGQARRVWGVVKAVDAYKWQGVYTASLGYDTSVGSHPKWFQQGTQPEGSSVVLDWYVGGFQFEDLGTAPPRAGIAAIGDSTIQGGAGSTDNPNSREIMSYLGGLLNADTYNRGIGGNVTASMDSRWATDITPLAALCRYVIIQGGINDISTGVALATIQANIASMAGKAVADGLTPVLFTCTPTAPLAADPVKEQKRLDLNKWIMATYPNAIDIASVVADPLDPKYLRRTPGGVAGWYGDGVHYSEPAKRAIAERVAAWPGWNLPKPTGYQKIAVATFAATDPLILTAPDGSRYRITVANGGALSAVAV